MLEGHNHNNQTQYLPLEFVAGQDKLGKQIALNSQNFLLDRDFGKFFCRVVSFRQKIFIYSVSFAKSEFDYYGQNPLK